LFATGRFVWRDSALAVVDVRVNTRQMLAPADTSFWSLLRPVDAVGFWTMVAGIGSCAVAFVAWRGLRSLRLSKTDMVNRAKRDSIQCAIDRCEQMAQELLPLNFEILSEFAARKVPVFVTDPAQVSFEQKEEVHKIRSALGWVTDLTPELQAKTIKLTNAKDGRCISHTEWPTRRLRSIPAQRCTVRWSCSSMRAY
jgi:hypothetical protein